MASPQKITLHGTAVALRAAGGGADNAVLLRGASGSGKSDLAFRLIETGGMLIGDDQVVLERRQDKIMAEAAEAIRGLLEVRGIGLVKYQPAFQTRLRLIVDLVPREGVPRLPDRETTDILGVAIACLRLHAFDASTPFKIIKAIELVHRPGLLVE